MRLSTMSARAFLFLTLTVVPSANGADSIPGCGSYGDSGRPARNREDVGFRAARVGVAVMEAGASGPACGPDDLWEMSEVSKASSSARSVAGVVVGLAVTVVGWLMTAVVFTLAFFVTCGDDGGGSTETGSRVGCLFFVLGVACAGVPAFVAFGLTRQARIRQLWLFLGMFEILVSGFVAVAITLVVATVGDCW